MDRDLTGMARVRRSVGTPIAADEPVTGVAEAQRVIDAGAADVLVVKLAGAGGIRNAQTIMELARTHGLGAVVNCGMETGVGLAAALHAAASLGSASASGLGTATLLEHDLLTIPLAPVRGHITVPQMPGLGHRRGPRRGRPLHGRGHGRDRGLARSGGATWRRRPAAASAD